MAGNIVNVASRFVPFVKGFEEVVTSGDLLGVGGEREIGNSIDSLLSANPTISPG